MTPQQFMPPPTSAHMSSLSLLLFPHRPVLSVLVAEGKSSPSIRAWGRAITGKYGMSLMHLFTISL